MKLIKSACIKQILVFYSTAAYEEYLNTLHCSYVIVRKKEYDDGSIEVEINKSYNKSPLYER